jgi:sugar/nucleoside kinase (ribokinase family)
LNQNQTTSPRNVSGREHEAAGVLCIGAAYVDITCHSFPVLPTDFGIDTEMLGDEYVAAAGGSAVNFARLCDSFGLTPTLIAKVGADPMGRLLVNSLSTTGIRQALIESDSVATNVSINLADGSGRTLMLSVGSANQSLTAAEVFSVAQTKLTSSSYLYFGGCLKLTRMLADVNDLVDLGHAHNCEVIVDHGRLNARVDDGARDNVRTLVRNADYYLSSTKEFLQMWGGDSVESTIVCVDDQIRGKAVVKDGHRGVVSVIDGQVIHISAFDVMPIHTIGAGDSFNAGFIAAVARGFDFATSMRLGCAAAALTISDFSLPTWSAVAKMAD